MIFDTHSHYNDKQYTQDREAVLASLKDAGVTQVVNVSASWKDLLDTLELIQKVLRSSDNPVRFLQLQQPCLCGNIPEAVSTALHSTRQHDPDEFRLPHT